MNQDIAGRYSQALLEVSVSEQKQKQSLKELSSFLTVVSQKEFSQFFFCPTIDKESKIFTLKRILENTNLSQFIKNFVLLLCKKDRFHLFEEILNSYKKKLYALEGLCLGVVNSTERLSEESLDQVKLRLEQVLNQKIVIEACEANNLMGGLSVDVLGKRFNNSVFSQLSRLKESIANRRV